MIPLFFSSEKRETYPPVTVLELFTSQGCSSCPLADKLLTEIQASNHGNQVVALSYHVDYWNYIGWKDPFSKKEFSNKQRVYSQKFNSSSIYTPQVVVNGKEHFVGSNSNIMHAKLKHYAEIPAENSIEITAIDMTDDYVKFNYNILGTIKDKSLRIVLVIDERITKIERGENRNLRLKNSNIVVAETIIELKKSKGFSVISLPKLTKKTDKIKLITIIQNSDIEIIGVSKVNL
ncbi:hypothetical protein A9Q86_11625 [Flavobacteriales bacterium 33_180_T64]|nr:hypothetical protein A9Q86_11625 [Flavobacteriales bacterium 33_180_T64]